MSKKEKIRIQDLRNSAAKGYIRIKIINNNVNSGYTSLRISATNGGGEAFDGYLSLSYKSKVLQSSIGIKPTSSKCYYDSANEYTYILPVTTAYTGVLEVLGVSSTIVDVECEIINNLDISSFEEIPL